MYTVGSEFKKDVGMNGIIKLIVVEVVSFNTSPEVNGRVVGGDTRKEA